MQTELDNLLTKVIELHRQAILDVPINSSFKVRADQMINYEVALKELRDKIQEYGTIIYI